MGTHPIFESDFDCLTEKRKKEIRRKWSGHVRDVRVRVTAIRQFV